MGSPAWLALSPLAYARAQSRRRLKGRAGGVGDASIVTSQKASGQVSRMSPARSELEGGRDLLARWRECLVSFRFVSFRQLQQDRQGWTSRGCDSHTVERRARSTCTRSDRRWPPEPVSEVVSRDWHWADTIAHQGQDTRDFLATSHGHAANQRAPNTHKTKATSATHCIGFASWRRGF